MLAAVPLAGKQRKNYLAKILSAFLLILGDLSCVKANLMLSVGREDVYGGFQYFLYVVILFSGQDLTQSFYTFILLINNVFPYKDFLLWQS